ncbi:hypothetical protein LSH36_1205g00102 [Paralvinella palmiformis]|uniref:DUF6815 domain-containing protein n=1 Tax=Paralvinella palmiformis TaxID=53620 RepID=A0AAD9IUP8_9ANNE|nr:hypothetical protein LSH36_1205g00102 [Paralvinella palmiformis]
MGKFKKVLVLEVECAKDKNPNTPGGKYRRDTPWLVESFKKKGVESEVLFITNADNADNLSSRFPSTAFLGRVNPMDYPGVLTLNEYVDILNGLDKKGLLLGPIPEHMDRLGSKMILYELRDSTMGVEGVKLHSYQNMKKNSGEIDQIIPKGGPSRVLKMMRGSTGLGVWKLENKSDDVILLTDAYTQKTEDVPRKEASIAVLLSKFCQLCQEDAISMPFLPLIKEGEFRFLMSKGKILEVVHKRPVDANAFTATLRSGAVYTILDLNEHKKMVGVVEKWSQDIKQIMKLRDIPYWWSVDCIEAEGCNDKQIPSSNPGRHLVLSEINCSCLGLVADTSEEAKQKGMRFADMIADICLD